MLVERSVHIFFWAFAIGDSLTSKLSVSESVLIVRENQPNLVVYLLCPAEKLGNSSSLFLHHFDQSNAWVGSENQEEELTYFAECISKGLGTISCRLSSDITMQQNHNAERGRPREATCAGLSQCVIGFRERAWSAR
ncbi:hypothetical protein EJ08DRAFT_65313 [Tothia fuscella]|uniref:Uncharacterized protein n=1 Tax=Tothia fuscella TaxID=1048955 RepID=A0A9P4NEY8_9PEZI|nr:hypothetical protein EJ08DRAFT_65313 [Tothia fuscella]